MGCNWFWFGNRGCHDGLGDRFRMGCNRWRFDHRRCFDDLLHYGWFEG
jgi:hypothetical protein